MLDRHRALPQDLGFGTREVDDRGGHRAELPTVHHEVHPPDQRRCRLRRGQRRRLAVPVGTGRREGPDLAGERPHQVVVRAPVPTVDGSPPSESADAATERRSTNVSGPGHSRSMRRSAASSGPSARPRACARSATSTATGCPTERSFRAKSRSVAPGTEATTDPVHGVGREQDDAARPQRVGRGTGWRREVFHRVDVTVRPCRRSDETAWSHCPSRW